jgi:hypothetical protein
MNRKNLIVLLVLVLTIGGIGLALFVQNRAAWNEAQSRLGQKFLADLKINDVAQIYIKQGKSELTLIKQGAGWVIKERGGFPADYAQVADFLLKARDLKVVQTEAIADAQRPRLDLADPAAPKGAGTLLEFRDSTGKPMRSLIIGRQHFGAPPIPVPGQKGPPDGRYLLVTPNAASYVLTSDPLNAVEPKAEKWLPKDFIRIDRVSSLSVTPPEGAAWKITRAEEAGQWQLAGAKANEKLDPSKAVGVVNSLYSPAFVDVVADPKPEQTSLDKPTLVAIETFDGFKYALKIGRKAGDPNDYLTLTVDADIAKQRSARADEKAEDKDKSDKEFAKKTKDLEDKLKREKALEKWVFAVEKKTFAAVQLERSQLLEQPQKAEPAPPKGATKPARKP